MNGQNPLGLTNFFIICTYLLSAPDSIFSHLKNGNVHTGISIYLGSLCALILQTWCENKTLFFTT